MMKLQDSEPDNNIYLAGGRSFIPSSIPLIQPTEEPAYFFIQFVTTLTRKEQERIQSQHRLSFVHYVPNFAFLERVDRQTWEALSQDPLYRAIERYKPEYRISPHLRRKKEFRTKERRNRDGLLVRVLLFPEVVDESGAVSKIVNIITEMRAERARVNQPGPRADKRRGERRSESAGPTEDLPGNRFDGEAIKRLDDRSLGGHFQLVFVLHSTESLQRISEIEEVQWIEEVAEIKLDGCPETNLVAGTIQSGTPGVTLIWDHYIDGRDQVIGILDSFTADITHCMFRDRSGVAIGPSHRKIVGRREPNGDVSRHATLVSGIAAGDEISNSGKGANRGIAWAAKLSLDDMTSLNNTQTLGQILDREAQDRATIQSNSWHDEDPTYNKNAWDVDNFVWKHEDHFVCGASGNRTEIIGPPGTAKNALCVSAGRSHPDQKEHADGPPGPTLSPDNRRKPEICAPGCGIHSALLNSGCLCTTPNCATSFATPVIAGAAALVRQYYLEGFHYAGVKDLAHALSPSAALVKATLLNSTVRMNRVGGEPVYPNGRTGWGLVKLDNTLFFEGGARTLFVVDLRNAEGLSKGQSRAYQVNVKSSAEWLKITLVWSEPPAESAAGKALINNLNLVVTSPGGGSTYLGNLKFVGGFSQPVPPNTTRDANNNVEMVIVENPTPGRWTITIECAAANVGKQGYALVATGALAAP